MDDSTRTIGAGMSLDERVSQTESGSHEVDLSNCEKEPIHTPGSIQPYGVLLVARQSDLRLVYASANAETVTKMPIRPMLGKPLRECLSPEILAEIIPCDSDGRLISDIPRTQASLIVDGTRLLFDVLQYQELIYLEIEPEILEPQTDRLPTRAQLLIDGLRSSSSLASLLNRAAQQLRGLSGYDRVMVYQFLKEGHGSVVAEDCADGMEPYVNLHYPASDIPAQARRLYLLQRIRVVADAQNVAVPVFKDAAMSTHLATLDMTYCNLRSVSPIHLEYLRNMGVRATLTLSLILDGQLWGMIVCHHREPKLPSPAMRSTCDMLSQIISFLIQQNLEIDAANEKHIREQAFEEISAEIERHDSIFDGLVAAQARVLEIVGAAGALLRLDGKMQCLGKTPAIEEADALMTKLQGLGRGKIVSSDCLSELLADEADIREDASGVLLLTTLHNPDEGILWFRPEVAATVMWGGNPAKAAELDATSGRLSPRKSFEIWKTCVKGRSLQWRIEDIQAAGNLTRTISTYRLTRAESAYSTSSLLDNLTTLPNRRHFQEKLRAWGERTDLRPAAVILINLDRFKLVNEAFGHKAGDDLLLQVARRLSPLMSENLLFARLGGDEFAALCVGLTRQEADGIAQSIGEALKVPFHVSGRPFHLTASVGVAHAAHGSEEELLRSADKAMHLAKQSGRNQSAVFDNLLHQTAIASLELEQDLYRALERKEFNLVYQPLVTLPEGELFGFEALLRWNHPTKGMIAPLNFISLAEETGLILPIGEWVLCEAILKIREWIEISGRPLTVHVNVAAQQLTPPSFVRVVGRLLREQGLPANSLSIEVTESVLMRDLAVDSLRELRAMGVRVSVDDFGTGYSSLAYLRKLPVDLVKIDKSFVQQIAVDDKSREFCAVILKLIQTLGLMAIAEGVETGEQGEVLSEMGCTRAQGYWYSRPLNIKAVAALLDQCKQTTWTIGRTP
jgi:diguanylate cyclase (GGDEF)-like protein